MWAFARSFSVPRRHGRKCLSFGAGRAALALSTAGGSVIRQHVNGAGHTAPANMNEASDVEKFGGDQPMWSIAVQIW